MESESLTQAVTRTKTNNSLLWLEYSQSVSNKTTSLHQRKSNMLVLSGGIFLTRSSSCFLTQVVCKPDEAHLEYRQWEREDGYYPLFSNLWAHDG